MRKEKKLFFEKFVTSVIKIFCIITLISISASAQSSAPQIDQAQIKKIIDENLGALRTHLDQIREATDKNLEKALLTQSLAYNTNTTAVKALALAAEASKKATETLEFLSREQVAPERLVQEYERLREALNQEAQKTARIIEDVLKKGESSVEDKIKIAQAKIQEKQQFGIYEQVKVEVEKEKWKNIKEIISDSKNLMKIAITIISIALCVYAIKYGTPALMNYLTKPHVISETSRNGWLDLFKSKQELDLENLIFIPSLQTQLVDLVLRVQSAKEYDEALPNVLFYGASGTGKTAFAKNLASLSGLDYALTSGSEFAKITDLNSANNELRKLLNWAKTSKTGLIVFIDEAESLFANRKLSTTSKLTQDFINTFLSLISDQSQKKVMFIFATNHPFKLDDAITDRIGINIEFTMPGKAEREKILSMYLTKFAKENEKAVVDFHPEIKNLLSQYASEIEGLSPRAIKFVAEEMIVNARHQEPKLLTNDIAQKTIQEVKKGIQQTILWEKERNEWSKDLKSNER